MNKSTLITQIKHKKSFLCIGLDTDIRKIPKHLLSYDDPIFEFNKAIVEATHDLCVAYKPNIAFYESMGPKGWQSLAKTMQSIPGDIFTIADAKRGDIGNTSALYARAFFEPEYSGLAFDSVTVAPYMGSDSVKPFLNYPDKWVILLILTSNEGSIDFQQQTLSNGKKLYETVLQDALQWGSPEQMMFVVGATQAEAMGHIRALAPHSFFLVPGVGAQGGSLEEVCKYGLNKEVGLLVNASRSIIYASSGEDFADKAREEALRMQSQMEKILAFNKLT